MHEQKTIKRGSRMHKARNIFRGKGVVLSKKYSNSSDSNLFRGSNLGQNSIKSDFCIITKMCLGVYFKTINCSCMCTPSYLSTPLGHYIYSNIDLNKMKDIDTQCYSLISIFAQKLSYFFLHESSITSNLHHTVFFFSCFIIKFIY